MVIKGRKILSFPTKGQPDYGNIVILEIINKYLDLPKWIFEDSKEQK